MRGLPELLTLFDNIYETLEEAPKTSLTLPSLPVVVLEERPSLATLTRRPIGGRHIVRRAAHKVAKPQEKADFSVAFDVSGFRPEDISVRMRDRDIIVEARHEERAEEERGYVSRQFTRRYTLPDAYDPATVATYLSADGKMTIKAFKPKAPEPEERIIPIKRMAEEENEEDEERALHSKKSEEEEEQQQQQP